MKQSLASPHRRSRDVVLPSRSQWHSLHPRTFTLQVRLRSQFGPICKLLCNGLEEAIRFGQSEFSAFSERNPWIGLDWLQRKIWILLDP